MKFLLFIKFETNSPRKRKGKKPKSTTYFLCSVLNKVPWDLLKLVHLPDAKLMTSARLKPTRLNSLTGQKCPTGSDSVT